MILFRSVFAELLQPFAMTMLVMAGLLVMEKVYRLVNLLVESRLNLYEVGMMLAFLMPQVLSFTLPLGVVGAVFVTVIRQSMDSEVISLRACGRSLWSYALPFVAFGLLVTLLTLPLTLWLQPAAFRQYLQLQVEMVRWRAETKLIAGEFNYDFGGKVIHIGGREGDVLTNIFITDREPSPTSPVITAQEGRIEVEEQAGQVVIRLTNGEIISHSANFNVFRTTRFSTLRYLLDYEPARAIEVKNLRGVPSLQLWADFQDPASKKAVRQRAGLEFFMRLTTPWACLAFALASLPMALLDPRSGKRAGYLRAIFLVAGYYIAWTAFKEMGRGGRAHPLAMWLPSALILVYGIMRLWQMNADIESLWRLFRFRRST